MIRVDRTNGAALPDNPFFSNSDPNARRIIAYVCVAILILTFMPSPAWVDGIWKLP